MSRTPQPYVCDECGKRYTEAQALHAMRQGCVAGCSGLDVREVVEVDAGTSRVEVETLIGRGRGATAARQAHNLDPVGSIPTPAMQDCNVGRP